MVFKIGGQITASGNKNSALPCILAALLTDEDVILENIPNINDVKVVLDILSDIGADILREGNTLKIKSFKYCENRNRFLFYGFN